MANSSQSAPRSAFHRASASSGASLIELLVVLFIAGILISLILAAVQYSREASRRTQCLSNIRQIVLGLQHYEAQHKAYPAGLSSSGSFLVPILPLLEQQSIYDEVQKHLKGRGRIIDFHIAVPSYYCPADPAPMLQLPHEIAGTNYAGNAGNWVTIANFNGMFRYSESLGANLRFGPVRVSEVTDGSSQTAMVSEILRADGSNHRLRVVWNTPRAYLSESEFDAFVNKCRSIPAEPSQYGWRGNTALRGVPWIDGNLTVTLYNHALPPNEPSCFNRGAVLTALSTAASLHGVVNVAFADGHTASVGKTVDLGIWRSFGSISGERL